MVYNMNKFNNCKTLKEIINLIDYKIFERVAFILLILWSINPIVEYFFKNIVYFGYTSYTSIIIVIVGVIGIFNYILYFYKYSIDNKLSKKDKFKFNFPMIFIFLMLIWAIISTFFVQNKNLAIYGESYRKEGLLVYLFYIGFILSGFIINKKSINILINIILISSFIIVILPCLNIKNTLDIFYMNEYTNIYFNLNHYGYFLMINVMLSLFMFIKESCNYKKILYLGLFICLSIFLVFNDTFGCILSVMITLIALFIYSIIFKWRRIEVLIGIIIFLILSLIIKDASGNTIIINDFKVLFNDTSTVAATINNGSKEESSSTINSVGTSRGMLWRYAFKFIKKHPIVGGGIECLEDYYLENNIDQDRPHNIFFQIGSFIGIPGILLYLFLIIYVGFKNLIYLKNKDNIQIIIFFTGICYFISSQFGNTMFYTSPYFLIMLGILIRYTKLYINKNSNK